MKKITSLLMLLCMFVGTAWGQTKVLDIASLTGEEELTFSTSSRGGWAVNADRTNFGSTNDHGFGTTVNYRNDQHVFQLKKNKGSLYLFSVYAQKYVNLDRSLSETATDSLTYVKQTDGTFVFKFSDQKIINLGGSNQMVINGWGDIESEYDAGNKITIMDVTEARLVKVVDVTYNYYINGKLYTSQVETQEINSEVEVPAQAFLTVVDYQGTIGEEDCEITVNCTENLPFVSSASYENAIWQVIDMHSSENNYTWKFVAADEPVETPVVAKSLNEMLGDEYYWAFVGNLFDGFKIYNKKAGGNLTLRKAETDNTISVMSSTNNKNQFKVYPSTAIDGAFCFKLDGDDYYLNKQGQDGKNILKGWNQTDNGSSCRSFSPASFYMTKAESYSTIPAGAVGAPKDYSLVEGVVSVLPAVKENEYNISKTAELSALLVQLEASEKYSLETGKPYRLQNLFRESMVAFDGTNRVKSPIGKTNVSNIWLFENAATDGKFYIKNLNANAYMKAADAGNDLVATDGAEYTVASLGCAQYNLQSGGNLVIYGGGNLGSWSPNPLGSDGAWYIIPATDIEVVVGKAGYATTYLPFDVVVPNTVEAYAVTATSNEYATLTKMEDIPANNGAILKGEGTHTLTIAKANSVWDGNLLEGTNVSTNVEAAAYILAKQGENIGFYPVKFEVSTDTTNDGEEGPEDDTFEAFKNKANKAYLPASAVPAGARFISFDFGGETSIDELKSENGNVKTVIYDLSGRRVQKAQKGIFIVNGKKVIK